MEKNTEIELSHTVNHDYITMLPKPKQIKKYLDEYIIGQDQAKKILAITVYNHYKRILSEGIPCVDHPEYQNINIEKSNMIMLGPTGCGKTFLIKTIANILGVPCYIADCTKLTESGYVGDDVESILVGLLREANYDINAVEHGIVVLDEVDKLACRSAGVSLTRDVGGEGVQQGLLKIVEGSVVGVPPQGGRKHPEQPLIYVNTENILFIGIGAFSGLVKKLKRKIEITNRSIGFEKPERKEIPEDNKLMDDITPDDLRKYGLIPEFIGRFPIITHIDQLKKEDIVKILTKPKNAIITQYKKLLYFNDVDLRFTPSALDEIAKVTLSLGTGARGIRGILETILEDVMFDLNDKEPVVINKKYVERKLKKYNSTEIKNNNASNSKTKLAV